MTDQASAAQKLEKKLGKQLGGYQAVCAKTRARIEASFEALRATKVELEVFETLKRGEIGSAPGRVEALEREVEKLKRREGELQGRYRELDEERRERSERIRQAEEELLIEQAEKALEAQQQLEEENGEGDDAMEGVATA